MCKTIQKTFRLQTQAQFQSFPVVKKRSLGNNIQQVQAEKPSWLCTEYWLVEITTTLHNFLKNYVYTTYGKPHIHMYMYMYMPHWGGGGEGGGY